MAKIVFGQFEVDRAEVFFETVELGRAGNRNDPWFLRQAPRERDLRRRGLLLRGDALYEIDDRLIGLPVLGIETRDGVAEVGRIERRRRSSR